MRRPSAEGGALARGAGDCQGVARFRPNEASDDVTARLWAPAHLSSGAGRPQRRSRAGRPADEVMGADVKPSYQGLLNRIEGLARDGHLGSDVQKAWGEYSALPSDITRSAAYVGDYFGADIDEELKWPRSLFCQLILVAYRDAKKRDPGLAHDFAYALFQDFPGAAGSALLPRWSSLAEASWAFQAVASSREILLLWQQSSRLVLAVNEFLDGLIGFVIVAWRCALGKTVNANVLGNAYGSKIDEFARLTGGEDGAFYLLLRIANADLRNGLAHGSAWLDSAEMKVRYVTGQHQKTEHEFDLVEFMSIATLGSHLGSAYVAALATIVVFEDGQRASRSRLPTPLVELLQK